MKRLHRFACGVQVSDDKLMNADTRLVAVDVCARDLMEAIGFAESAARMAHDVKVSDSTEVVEIHKRGKVYFS